MVWMGWCTWLLLVWLPSGGGGVVLVLLLIVPLTVPLTVPLLVWLPSGGSGVVLVVGLRFFRVGGRWRAQIKKMCLANGYEPRKGTGSTEEETQINVVPSSRSSWRAPYI